MTTALDSDTPRLITKDEDGFERIVFAEVLLPDTPNSYGDYHTAASVKEFAYGFMMQGFGIDLQHDNYDVTGKVSILESFIAREGDPDFKVGAWVVGMRIHDDDIWAQVLSGEINGYSYEAFVRSLEVDMELPIQHTAYGMTQPDPYNGHVHDFYVVLDDNGSPVIGGTGVTNGHSHTISRHTYTDTSFEHAHLFNYVRALGE